MESDTFCTPDSSFQHFESLPIAETTNSNTITAVEKLVVTTDDNPTDEPSESQYHTSSPQLTLYNVSNQYDDVIPTEVSSDPSKRSQGPRVTSYNNNIMSNHYDDIIPTKVSSDPSKRSQVQKSSQTMTTSMYNKCSVRDAKRRAKGAPSPAPQGLKGPFRYQAYYYFVCDIAKHCKFTAIHCRQ